MSEPNDKLLASNYDGIQEYDNDLPRWWVALFWGCIIFGGFYTVYYEFGSGLSPNDQLVVDMEELQKTRQATAASKPVSADTEEALLALASNPDSVAKGKAVYLGKCLACHGANGEGIVGPNLTDSSWIHGATMMENIAVVRHGVLAKGMLAWEGVIPDEEIRAVVAYIYTLRGTNPPNAKPAEGTPAS